MLHVSEGRKWPVHRWLFTDESWPPTDVLTLLDKLEIASSDTVYDPFVGFGTTAVVCSEKGIATFNCDISSLAALVTQMKLYPPLPDELGIIETIIEQHNLDELLRALAYQTLMNYVPNKSIKLMKFILAASLLRIDWDYQEKLAMDKLREEIDILMAEIYSDIPHFSAQQISHYVCCAEFPYFNPARIKHFATSQIVMVTSPPFFGSNVSPLRKRLNECLGKTQKGGKNLTKTSIKTSSKIPSFLTSLSSTNHESVAEYLLFLENIILHAKHLGCRAVGIEMAPKEIEGKWIAFDDFLAQCLIDFGYIVDTYNMPDTLPEKTTGIFGKIPQNDR